MLADFTATDTDPFPDSPEALLTACISRTVLGGRATYERSLTARAVG